MKIDIPWPFRFHYRKRAVEYPRHRPLLSFKVKMFAAAKKKKKQKHIKLALNGGCLFLSPGMKEGRENVAIPAEWRNVCETTCVYGSVSCVFFDDVCVWLRYPPCGLKKKGLVKWNSPQMKRKLHVLPSSPSVTNIASTGHVCCWK